MTALLADPRGDVLGRREPKPWTAPAAWVTHCAPVALRPPMDRAREGAFPLEAA